MSLNQTPSGERVHISFFGMRNAGKSSVVNAVTGQNLAVVSDTLGTTTDPVYKAMELLPIGPVMIIDTPGFDDEGELGRLRVQKTKEILRKTDIAVLVTEHETLVQAEQEYVRLFEEKKIPYVLVYNKSDLTDGIYGSEDNNSPSVHVSALTGDGIIALKEKLGSMNKKQEGVLVMDLVDPGDYVVLVIPIDESAPKGRIILPQQQVLRELLEVGAYTICCQDTELEQLINVLGDKISLVITDSQVFEKVSQIVPDHIYLTSFSILMARYKGFLETAIAGVRAIESLKDGSRILISEGCTHHRQCADIGSVKIPNWLRKHTGKDISIELSSGREFPEDLHGYDLIIHCGGCMLNPMEVQSRMNRAVEQGIPFTNYGITIAYMKGIINRSIRVITER